MVVVLGLYSRELGGWLTNWQYYVSKAKPEEVTRPEGHYVSINSPGFPRYERR